MSHLFLIRHGQSEWNLQKRFTGWADVDLTAAGKLEACKAGELIKDLKIEISFYYSSYQIRALNTLKLILNTIRIKEDNIIKAWQLNERHYGELTGLKKDEMKKILGEEKIFKFRRSWDFPPGPLSRSNPNHFTISIPAHEPDDGTWPISLQPYEFAKHSFAYKNGRTKILLIIFFLIRLISKHSID